MNNNDILELSTINDTIIKRVCGDICRAKCCKSSSSDFDVPISMSEYERLLDNGFDNVINWKEEYPKLKKLKNGSCVFLSEENYCKIHHIRPQACKNYPFRHLKAKIDNFCILYHKSPETYRKDEALLAIKYSTTEYLFDRISEDGKPLDDIASQYMKNYQ